MRVKKDSDPSKLFKNLEFFHKHFYTLNYRAIPKNKVREEIIMTLKMTFLGSGSAFTVGPENYHSNILLEKNKDTLLIDAGTDLKLSLNEQKLTYKDVHNIYISHLHHDHAGGVEWLALASFFDPTYKRKPNLYVSDKVIGDLWNKTLAGGLSTLLQEQATINTFFNPTVVKENGSFIWQDVKFKLVQTIHFYSNFELMPTYGLFFSHNNTKILFTADSQTLPGNLAPYYEEADVIFHDCETTQFKSIIHAHYSDLAQLPAHIKNKMWLYHYNPGPLPDAKQDGFLGFVHKGQSFKF